MKKVFKLLISILSLFLFVGILASCDEEKVPTVETQTPTVEVPTVDVEVDQKEAIYKMAVSSGYTGTYEEWLNSIKGDEIELALQNGYIVWKYKSETTWRQLFSLTALQGQPGTPGQAGEPGKDGEKGADGVDGKTPEFRVNDGYLEWKYTSDSTWIKLYEISTGEMVDSTTPIDTITVTYVTEWEMNGYDIEIIKSVEREVNAGPLTKPEDLVPEGYLCDGWYFYDEYEDEYVPWKFNLYYASEDITLIGVFSEKFTVTYLDEYGNVIKEAYASYNNGLRLDNYEAQEEEQNFIYWVNEEDDSECYYAGSKIYPTSNITLKPYIAVAYKVTYLDENGNIYKILTVTSLDPYAQKIEYTPYDEAYCLSGWELNDEEFDFNIEITSDIILKPILVEGKKIELIYSGTLSDQEFNLELIEDFKKAMKEAGDPNTYEIRYVAHGPDKVDSEVVDWSSYNAPDVYEFASDKINGLYSKGALARITGPNAKFIDEEFNAVGKNLATFNDAYYGYPYAADNTYYLQYDKSVINPEDAYDMIKLMDAAHEKGYKVGYCSDSFWMAAAMFTFGADFYIDFTEDGQINNISADFNSEKGLKAAKAIYEIINHPAWVNTASVPGNSDNVCAVIGGTWDVAAYKALWGNNYACAVMPTVTVDGETKHLGAFLGGKLLGVNPQRAAGNADQIEAAHKLAKFLAGKECQLKRFEYAEIAPCHLEAAKDPKVQASPNVAVLVEQGTFAHAQTAVPDGIWSAPYVLVDAIRNGECTLDNLQDYLEAYNNTVLGKYF